MSAMPLLITAGTPQRTATLPHTTAGMDRVTALFAPHTHTTGRRTIAGIVTGGDRGRGPAAGNCRASCPFLPLRNNFGWAGGGPAMIKRGSVPGIFWAV